MIKNFYKFNKKFVVQKKVHEEIKRIGKYNLNDLPYCQAVMKESLRYRVPGPLSVPHLADEDIELSGYTIPKGTIIFHNVLACRLNEEDWEDPEKF